MNIKTLSAYLMAAILGTISCSNVNGSFSRSEKRIIKDCDSIMRVLTTRSEEDMAVLRAKSTDLSAQTLASDEFSRLAELMVATVTHPSQDGVGIAAPQVGLNRRVIAVQRFDKEGEPFEVYANVRIVWTSDTQVRGGEGCLSVPDMRGDVLRAESITIEYADLNAIKNLNPAKTGNIPVIRENINGFTAVIFQHEIDHLEGILYIDRL